MGKGNRKKEVIDIFPTFCTLRNLRRDNNNNNDDNNDEQEEVNPNDIRNGEFRDTAIYFSPSQPRGECGLTIRFRCTAKLIKGDIITFKLTGFKGEKATVFALESRPNPENNNNNNKTFHHHHFIAYYSGDNPPKGSVPPQVLVLKCRREIRENELVIIGVPEAVHIILPDKLALNSTKLKVEGRVCHTEGGRIPKSNVFECTEVRKRTVQEDIEELEGIIDDYFNNNNNNNNNNGTDDMPSALEKDDMDIIKEISAPECDAILEAAKDIRSLPTGLSWKIETSVFRNYNESCRDITKILRDSYSEEYRVPMALHKELARNLKVKISAIIVLEEALAVTHGAYYPELSRCAIMVLRLYTCESHDIEHLLGVFHAPCIHREINSGMRSKNPTIISNWINFIAVLSTTTSNDLTYISRDVMPSLFTGIRELPNDQLMEIQNLKKGDWYVTNNFLTCVTDTDIDDEGFTCPDNAILFEIRGAVSGIETGDCSQYPQNREWLLPLFSSFTVVSVAQLQDTNGLIHVVLDMNSCLGGNIRDPLFPIEERLETVTKFFKRAQTTAITTGLYLSSSSSSNNNNTNNSSNKLSRRTSSIAKCIFTNIRLNDLRNLLSHDYLAHSLYLSQYTETKYLSAAKISQDEGLCKWVVCVHDKIITDGIVKPAVWEAVSRKIAIYLESYYLRRTRSLKQFNCVEMNFVVDFVTATIDIGGKGPRGIRRVVGRVDSYPFKSL